MSPPTIPLAAWLLLGCGGDPGVQADKDRAERIARMGPMDHGLVAQEAQAIVDPVRRTSAVMGWVEAHQGQLQPGAAEIVCMSLEEPGRSYCQRRVISPHLQAPLR